VQRDDVVRRQPGEARDLRQIGGEFAFIADRHVPQPRADARVVSAIEQRSERALQLAPARQQRIVIDRQRAEGRDRLDDPDRRARTDYHIEAEHELAQPSVDAVPELDDESAVAGRQVPQSHRRSW